MVCENDVSPEDNWGPRISKINCTLRKWSKRFLTFYGKTVIVNTGTLIGPGINYVCSVVSCPPEFVKRISNAIWKFFLDGKVEKIKRKTIIGPANMGGTGLVDVGRKLTSLEL